jgi:DnaJ family protein C protein 9
MDDTQDPMHQFFPPDQADEENILYKTLELEPECKLEEIKKTYRRLALKYHPDKHVSTNTEEKESMSKAFQRVGFAYAVLGDEGRRKR